MYIYIMNTHNGRVNILENHTAKQFSLYDKIPVGKATPYTNALGGQQEKSLLSVVYFSKENIQIVHNAIRAGVYEKSNKQHVIGPQSIDTLKIIMRSIYLTNAVNKPCNITQQVIDLNQMVVDFAVPQVFGEVKSYIKYKEDISTLVVPLKRPANMSRAGHKTLELKPFF
jgi:hypothetical protein